MPTNRVTRFKKDTHLEHPLCDLIIQLDGQAVALGFTVPFGALLRVYYRIPIVLHSFDGFLVSVQEQETRTSIEQAT